MDTQKITIIGLGIGIVLVIQFFLISDFMDRKEDQSPEIFQKGYDLGIENTIKSLFVKTWCNELISPTFAAQ